MKKNQTFLTALFIDVDLFQTLISKLPLAKRQFFRIFNYRNNSYVTIVLM